jgi:hypothetical protein
MALRANQSSSERSKESVVRRYPTPQLLPVAREECVPDQSREQNTVELQALRCGQKAVAVLAGTPQR